MKAARFYDLNKPLKIEDTEMPEIGPEDALVRVRACGVCGGDIVHTTMGLPGFESPKVPMTLGHEPAGDVIEVGNEVEGFSRSDRVCAHFYISCGKCHFCMRGRESLCTRVKSIGYTTDGAFAEYIAVPARNLVKLPEEISYEVGGILTDSVATAYHAVTEIAKVRPGEVALIMGAGGLGLPAIQIAKLSGAYVIAVDRTEEKLKVAEENGADFVIDSDRQDVPSQVKKVTQGEGADAIFEFVAVDKTMRDAYASLRRRGRLVFVGHTLDQFKVLPISLLLQEHQILGSRASSRHELMEVVRMTQVGRIRPVRIQTFPLDRVNEAMDLLKSGKILGRAVVTP